MYPFNQSQHANGNKYTYALPVGLRSIKKDALAYSPKHTKFCMLSNNGKIGVCSNVSEMNTWSEINAPNNNLHHLMWINEMESFYAVNKNANQSSAAFSSDGNVWVNKATNISDAINKVCWAPELNMFCAASNDNNMLISSNGIEWKRHKVTLEPFKQINFTDVCWSPKFKLFCAVGKAVITDDVYIIMSKDGKAWTFCELPQMFYIDDKNTKNLSDVKNITSIIWNEFTCNFIACGYYLDYVYEGKKYYNQCMFTTIPLLT